jgi:hypothetical protein
VAFYQLGAASMNNLHRRRSQILDARLQTLTRSASNLIDQLNELNGLRELVRKAAQVSDQQRRERRNDPSQAELYSAKLMSLSPSTAATARTIERRTPVVSSHQRFGNKSNSK